MALHRIRCNFIVYGFIITYILLYWALLRRTNTSEQGGVNFHRPSPRAANISRSFNPENRDVMVFFHIQKTGGSTFNGHLVRLNITPPCECFVSVPEEGGCRCRTVEGYTWLFSRFTTASACGVHPPLLDLRDCVPKYLSQADAYEDNRQTRFLYTTVLRDPVKRYLSEWKHVQKMGPWPSYCNQDNDVQGCLKSQGQDSISLQDFINCPGNPANNRQVRMIASYGAHQCEDMEADQSGLPLVERAKMGLRNLDFFGLTEHQVQTRNLFEWTFGTKFLDKSSDNLSTTADEIISSHELPLTAIKTIMEKNKLDVELYQYAKDLFYYRYNIMKQYRL